MVLFHPRAFVSKQMLPQGVTKGKERSMGFAQGHTGLLRPSPGPFSPDLEGIETGKSSREPRKTWGPCSAVMSQVASRARGSEHEAVPGNFSGRSGLGCLPLGADLAGRAATPHTIPDSQCGSTAPAVCMHFPTSSGSHFITGQKRRPDPVLCGFKPSLKHLFNGLAEGCEFWHGHPPVADAAGKSTQTLPHFFLPSHPASLEWPCDPLLSNEM